MVLTIMRKMLQFILGILYRGKQMAGINFEFDKQKAIEAILYLVSKAPVANLYGICKFIYLADKASLEKYGRFIFGESYVAMQQGSVPSNSYDILKNPPDDLEKTGYYFKITRQPDLDYLSRTDVECLDKVIEEYGEQNSWARRKIASHDTAWEIAWSKKGLSKSYPIRIEDIAELFEKPDELIHHLLNTG